MKRIPYGHQCVDDKDIQEVVKVLRGDWLTQGPKIKEFEEALCKYTGAKYAVVVSSGTAALHVACLVAGIGAGDEVITSPITFVASANCVLYCGGKPVFADIEQDTVNIDPKEIRKNITKRTKAIIPVHFAGHPCDLEEIRDIAHKHNLTIIEDAAHALGAKYKCSKIGSCEYSDMTVFSFHPVKSITMGEGGAVLTNKRDLYEKLLLFRSHGITKNRAKIKRFEGPWYYEMRCLGFNYRATDFQCALGISQLNKIDEFITNRRKISVIYNEELSKISRIGLPIERPEVESAWHLYPIRIDQAGKRREIFERLLGMGIGVQVHYFPVYLQAFYKIKFGYKEGFCPEAENYYRRTITLPLYPAMKKTEVRHVVKSVVKIMRQNSPYYGKAKE